MLAKRLVAIVLVLGQVALGVPVQADTTPPPPPTVVANRTVPRVDPVPLVPTFSESPTTEEIERARVFGEPILAVGGEPSPEENKALAAALLGFHQGAGRVRFSRLESFLASYPQSPYRASILLNLGKTYWRDGYFTRAFVSLDQAWANAKGETSSKGRAVANATLADLLHFNLAYGHQAPLEELLSQVEDRDVSGAAVERVSLAKEAVAEMRNHHDQALPSGPNAVWRVQVHLHGQGEFHPALKAFKADHDGASMAEMEQLARRIGLDLKPAYRQADAPIPIPSLAHLKGGHFTAIVGENATHYKLDDFVLGGEVWVTKDALADDSSGYFLIPGELGDGWRAATRRELANQRGKCVSAFPEPDGEPGTCTTCPMGMATYNFGKMLASLWINDTPVGYDPPRGPSVKFHAAYHHRSTAQPTSFTFSNMGPKWTHGWLSYVEDDPANLPAATKVNTRDGLVEKFDSFDATSSAYRTHRDSQAVLVRTASSPIRYERRLPDGSVEVYAQSDGATSPRRVFLTQSIDPQGQSVTYTYDGSLRLVAVTDVIGQVTTLAYGHTGDPLKITKVTDPFGRSAHLEYNTDGKLTKITDVIGMASQFEYGTWDFISSLVTPYGKTTFSFGSSAAHETYRMVEAQDPLGGRERVEFHSARAEMPGSDAVMPTGFGPNSDLNNKISFYWDKRAMALHPGDLSKAEQTTWMWGYVNPFNGVGSWTPIPRTVKTALEGRVWYAYAGNNGGQGYDSVGPMSKPTKIGRVLDDGASQIYRYEYNPKGHPTRLTDPVARTTIYNYAANEVDLLEVRQVNGLTADLLQTRTYNGQHEPLTITDAAGQTTTYTYNANGTYATIVTPPRGGLSLANRTTTYSYVPTGTNGEGHVRTIAAPLGATTSLTYDGYARTRTVTDSDNYTLTYDYDGLDRHTKTTYPDGTSEEVVYVRLDAERTRDRLGRWTHVFHDALGHPVSKRDPLGQTTSFQWCTCGSLDKFTDANGNATALERDVLGRVTRQVRPDATTFEITYENATSRVKQIKDPKGQLRNYGYFLDGRLKEVTYTNETQPTADLSFTYDAAYGRLQTMADGTGTTSLTYHAVTSPTQLGAAHLATVDGPLLDDTMALNYDELGRVVQQQINGSANVSTQAFDALSRITTEANALGTFNVTYQGATGRPSTISYPASNGQTTSFAYLDNIGDHRLSEIHHSRSGGATLSRFNYATSAIGSITSWTQQADANAAIRYDFGYDPTDQVTAAVLKTTGGTPSILKSYGYGYDKGGNRTAEAADNTVVSVTYNAVNRPQSQQAGGALRFAGVVNEPATVSVADQLAQVSASNQFERGASVSVGSNTVAVTATDPSGNARTNNYQVTVGGSAGTFTHDSNGNLTSDGVRTYEWDAEDRLVTVIDGTRRSEFSYNGAGLRVRMVERDGATVLSDRRYVWYGISPSEERDSTGSIVTRRFFLQGMREGSDSYFYTRDHLGSVREMTDGTGAVRARYDYDPFGRQTKLSGDKDAPFGFTGHFTHVATGLVLALYRAYSPRLGRWINEDPLGPVDGPNLYAYVLNQAITAYDPAGAAIVLAGVPIAVLALGAALVTTAVVVATYYATKVAAETILEMTKPKAPAPPPGAPPTTPPPSQPPPGAVPANPPAPPQAPPTQLPPPPPSPPQPGQTRIEVPSKRPWIPRNPKSCRVTRDIWRAYCKQRYKACTWKMKSCELGSVVIYVWCIATGGAPD